MTSYQHESAKIYQFPIGGRAMAGGRRDDVKSAAQPTSPRVSATAFGGSWYHEEAVQDAERARRTLRRLPTR
jgi:hypothetical protein